MGILGGLRAFLGGIGFILGTPSVWGYALVPALMALVLLGCSCPLGIWGAHRATDLLVGEVTGFWATTGVWALKAVLWLLAVLVAVLLALGLAQPLSGFALEAIARAQARSLGVPGWDRPAHLSTLLLTVRVTLLSLGLGIPALLLLFVVGLFFPPALVVTLPLKFLVCAWMLAWDFLDYPFGLRGVRIRDRLQWVARRFGAFTAFGGAWTAFLIVPGVVLLVLPMGVAGATRMVVAEEH
jgi:CysZ protein